MRRTLLSSLLLSFALGLATSVAHAGPFAPAAGQTGSTAVPKNDPSIVGWATGTLEYAPGANVDTGFQTPAKALGAAVGDAFDIVSLGDAGRITLTFDKPITNGDGFDFAIFENSFSDQFLELAFVEVSSNGRDFARFVAVSLTPAPVSSFGVVDPTNVTGLAGKYRQGFGTPFDLSLLLPTPNVDVNAITHVRLVDVVGDGSEFDGWPTLAGGPNRIYDPYRTTGSGGFDLDAVGVMHFANVSTPVVPEPSTVFSVLAGFGLLLPAVLRRTRRQARPRRPGDSSMNAIRTAALAAATLLAATTTASAAVSTFEDVPLPGVNSYLFPEASVNVASGTALFNHDYTDFGFPGCCWSGWTVSNVVDTTTPGFGNQYAAYPGGGVGGSSNYAVAYFGEPRVTLAEPNVITGAWFTNTTYAALSMRDGDGFAKKFGGTNGDDPDYLVLDITGRDAAGGATGTVSFHLADFTFDDDTRDYIVDTWTWVDLSSLGSVSALSFALRSSDVGPFGINTPAYFAMDDLKVVPEPGTWALVAAGLLAVGAAASRRRSTQTA